MFFDDFFVEGFTIGFCVSNLKTMIELSDEDERFAKILYERYPLITDDIKQEIRELKISDDENYENEKDFFNKNKDLFMNSDIYIEAETKALYFLKRKQIDENLNYFFKGLKFENVEYDENNYLIVLLDTNYAKRTNSIIEDNSTIGRIELAKKLINLKETSISEINELVKANEISNKEDYFTFRYKNYILEISSISKNDYNIYKLYNIPKKDFWRIIKTNCGEKLEILKIDDYNRLI